MKDLTKDSQLRGLEEHKNSVFEAEADADQVEKELDYFDKDAFEKYLIIRLERGMTYRIGNTTYDIHTFIDEFIPKFEKEKRIMHNFEHVKNYLNRMREGLFNLHEEMVKAVNKLGSSAKVSSEGYKKMVSVGKALLLENDKLKEQLHQKAAEIAVLQEKLKSQQVVKAIKSPEETKVNEQVEKLDKIKEQWISELRDVFRDRREQRAKGELKNTKTGKSLKLFPKQLCNKFRVTLEYQMLEREGVDVKELVNCVYDEVAKEYVNMGELQEGDYDR